MGLPTSKYPRDTQQLRIIIEEPFETWASRRPAFIADLTGTMGIHESQITNEHARAGCTIWEATLPAATLEKFVEYWGLWLMKRPIPDEFQQFFDKHKITQVINFHDLNEFIYARKSAMKEQISKGRKALIFVHGWGGGETTFGQLPAYIQKSGQPETITYEYPSSVFGHSPQIHDVAAGLENFIRNRDAYAKIGFVAHSMGGLIVKKLLLEQRFRNIEDRLDLRTVLTVFIATPHTGVTIAKLATSLPGVSSDQTRALQRDSEYYKGVLGNWAQWRQKDGGSCISRSFYGTKDRVVGSGEALAEDAEAIACPGEDHVSICKPRSRDSEIVLSLIRIITKAGLYERQSA